LCANIYYPQTFLNYGSDPSWLSDTKKSVCLPLDSVDILEFVDQVHNAFDPFDDLRTVDLNELSAVQLGSRTFLGELKLLQAFPAVELNEAKPDREVVFSQEKV